MSYSPLLSRRDFLSTTLALSASLASSRLLRAQTTAPASPISFIAHPLPLSAVRLTGGPLLHAQQLGQQNLLKLEPDRMMFHLRRLAGLDPKAPQGYGSWDGPGRNLTGHIAGHYLSGVSYMYAATGDDRFKQRADYLVEEMDAVQKKRGNGYIGALMGGGGRGNPPPPLTDGVELFAQLSQGQIRSGGFDLNGMWSPWYVQHKIFAGLRDAYRHAHNPKALELSTKFAAWVESILAPLDAAQIQRMLSTEFGGMNESLVDLYVDTQDRRWLALSEKFLHHAIVDPLANRQDILGGKHGNTQVPKLLGELARYIATGNEPAGDAAQFFWQAVVNHHSFATGGHGYDEYFDAPDKLSDEIDGKNHRSTDLRTCESCNVYNMLKYTRLIFALAPSDASAAFLERALFNHTLASINFNDGQVCYMVPVGQGVSHEYQGNGFTCCVGSGLETHALHAEGIYSDSPDRLWVNLFAPSTAESKTLGLKLAMETAFPEGPSATLKLSLDAPREFTLSLRRPAWAGPGYSLQINGTPVENRAAPGNYIDLKRLWKTGDTLAFNLPQALHKEPLPDNPNRVALLAGPIVLGADLGPAQRGRRAPSSGFPVFLAPANAPPNSSVDQWLKPAPEKPHTYTATGTTGNISQVTFLPFYQLSGRQYAIYCDVYTPDEWAKHSADQEAESRRALQAATISYAQPGQMQSERDFNYQGDGAVVVPGQNPARRGGTWFSFDLPIDPTHPMTLLVTVSTTEPTPQNFNLLLDGTPLQSATITPTTQPAAQKSAAPFADLKYPLPPDQVANKQKITIRLEPNKDTQIPPIYGLRIIRTDK